MMSALGLSNFCCLYICIKLVYLHLLNDFGSFSTGLGVYCSTGFHTCFEAIFLCSSPYLFHSPLCSYCRDILRLSPAIAEEIKNTSAGFTTYPWKLISSVSPVMLSSEY